MADAQEKIAFDKFHVHLGDAVDRVRRAEHRRLAGADDQRLKGSRYRWLTNPENMDEERWEQFAELRDSALATNSLWAYAVGAQDGWRGIGRRSAVGWSRYMIKRHLEGSFVDNVTNARAESIRGFRR